MAHLVQTEGQFSGVKTGKKKDSSEEWLALQFKIPECYKGVTIPPQSMATPNLLIFPKTGDFRDLQEGHTYRLKLAISVRKGANYPDYELIELAPK